MTFLRSISLVGWTLSTIHSASGIPRLAGSGVRLGLALNSRQAGLPNAPQCDSTCDPIGTILGAGSCPPTECCMPSFQSGYFDCVKCVGLATNATTADWVVAQNDVDGAGLS
ncbi:hypothetical protein B0H14DRAFT_2679927 [Mycena olivaceomarginata]|nr:hypothetical protein B0H14DRAFT_2679927 [Mycena olivaceomarginata]